MHGPAYLVHVSAYLGVLATVGVHVTACFMHLFCMYQHVDCAFYACKCICCRCPHFFLAYIRLLLLISAYFVHISACILHISACKCIKTGGPSARPGWVGAWAGSSGPKVCLPVDSLALHQLRLENLIIKDASWQGQSQPCSCSSSSSSSCRPRRVPSKQPRLPSPAARQCQLLQCSFQLVLI